MCIGETILEHYESYFGNDYINEIYSISDDLPSIQILKWKTIIKGYTILATFGLSHFSDKIGNLCEIVTIVNNTQIEEVSQILGNISFTAIMNELPIECNIAYTRLSKISKNFVNVCNKNSIYFSFPYIFSDDFFTTDFNGNFIEFPMAIFISDREFSYYKINGFEELENFWYTNNIDILNLNRKDTI